MKTLYQFIFCCIVFLIVFSTLTNANSLKINTGSWQIVKQEKDTDTYISDKYSKTPLICEVYPEAKAKKDLPSRNIYTTKDKSEKKSLEQKTIKEKWANCYQVSTEKYVQIGDNSTILIYQNYSMVEYIDGDNNELVTSFLLKKFNGTDYKIEPNDIWIKTEEECINLGKEGLCFGATDNSMNEGQLANYRYEITSTEKLVLIDNFEAINETFTFNYPLFYTYQKTGDWKEVREEYNFDDICKKSYANCEYYLTSEYAGIVNFVSDKYIDPEITNVSACATLNLNDTYYQLTENINSTGTCITITANNVTIDGNGFTITYGTNSSNSYGVYVSSVNDTVVKNLKLTESVFLANTRYGIYVSSAKNTYIENVTITTNSLNSHGVYSSASKSTYLNASSILTGGTSAFGVYYATSPNSTIDSNNVNTTGSSSQAIYLQTCLDNNVTSNKVMVTTINTAGIYIASSSSRTNIKLNEVLTKGGNGYGIYIASCLNQTIENNKITTKGNNAFALLISTSANLNILRSNILNVTHGNRISVDASINVILENNTIINRKPAFYDISIGASSNNLTLINQTPLIENYSFSGAGSQLNIIEPNGKIVFGVINGTGDSLSKQIIISDNFAFVNSTTNLVFNKTSNITLFNIGDRGFISPRILKDGVICEAPYCTNYTSLEATNVIFNVNSWSNYSIGENLDSTNPNATILNPANNSTHYTNQNFTVNLTDNIGLKNATLYIFNSTNSEVNRTTFSYIYGSLQSVVGVVVDLMDGVYTWFYEVFDIAGNKFVTENYTMTKLSYSAPSVIFNNQIPSDLNLTNFIGVSGMNITYNITDVDNDLNISTIKLYFKSNSSIDDVMYYQNGTAYSGYFSSPYISNISSTFNWNLKDNEVLQGTYNFGEYTLENTIHSANALTQTNEYVSVELLNISNSLRYSFFEMMSNSTNIQRFYYCNSSYLFSNSPLINSNCILIYTLPSAQPYDHLHTNYSSHHVIPFTINTTNGKVGTVAVTSKSYFLLRGAGTTQFYSIANNSRNGAFRKTTNSGNSWTNQTYTIDAHAHQFSDTSSIWYYACANDTTNLQNCSVPRQDLFELGGLPPTSPNVYSPQNITYYFGENISINYTASESPNSYPIIYYNISLMNEDLSFNQTIINNNSNNLGYSFLPTLIGNFTILVTAYDSIGQSSDGYSEIFQVLNITIDTIAPNYTNLSPANSTYTNNTNINFSLNATDDTNLSNGTIYIYNSTGSLVNTTTVNLNDTSSIFSVVYDFVVDGVYYWLVMVYDKAGNFVETVLQKITIDTTSPDMAYTLPTLSNGSTILDDFIEVNVTATDLNLSSINIYFYQNYTLNQTINSLTSPFYHKFENLNNNTKYQFNASACDSLNYCTTLSTREITINSSISGTAELLVQISQYPYIDINQSTLFEGILTINGIPITDSNVNIFITNGTANWTYPMVYSSGTYKVNLQFTQEGDYVFIVTSQHSIYGNNSITGLFYVRTPFYLTYEFITSSQNNTWYNFLIGNKYINEYAYVTAELLTNPRKYDPNIEPFFAQLPLTTRNQTPVWYGEYSNGIATIKLYETGNYAIRLIDGDITFTSDYSVPNITQSYGVNSYIGQTYLNNTTSKVELLTTKKLKPFTWLFNVILIILIIVSVIGSLFLFFIVPESPSIAISFGLIIPIVLIIVRILLWVWVA